MFGFGKKRLLRKMGELSDIARNVISITLLEVFEEIMGSKKAEILSSGVGNYLFGKELEKSQLENFSRNEIQSIGNLIIKNEPEIRELVIQSLRVISGIEYMKGTMPAIPQILSIYGSEYPNEPNPESYEVLVDWAINNLTNPESEYISMYRDDYGKSPDTRKFREFGARLTRYLTEALSLEKTTLEAATSEIEKTTKISDRPEITKKYTEIVQTASKFIETSLSRVSEINEDQSRVLLSFELGVIDALAQRANLEFDDSLKIIKMYLTEVKGMSVTEREVNILFKGLSEDYMDLANIKEGGVAVYDWLEGNSIAQLELSRLLSMAERSNVGQSSLISNPDEVFNNFSEKELREMMKDV